MPIKSIARLIQTMLYAKRMFPYYVYNVLAGIEEDGESLLIYVFLSSDGRKLIFGMIVVARYGSGLLIRPGGKL